MGILGCGDVTEIKVAQHSKKQKALKLKLLWEEMAIKLLITQNDTE
jgi:hypothetical protein